MSEVLFCKRLGRYLFLMLLLVGCATRQTYEESKYQFIKPLGVLPDQTEWVPPETLEIHKVSSRQAICEICNSRAAEGKGSHFKIFGLHKVAIQDRGCYIHSDSSSVGRVYYLAGDWEAKEHEIAHHFQGPKHESVRLLSEWPRSFSRSDSQMVGMTGSRIIRPLRQR